MAMVIQGKDGAVTEIDGKTGEILAKKPDLSDWVEVEALIDHMNLAGLFVPKGGSYKAKPGRAMTLVQRGVVRLKKDESAETKMAEPVGAEVAEPAVAKAAQKAHGKK